MKDYLNQPLQLPCGVVIPNRIGKAAMTEGLADESNMPTAAHACLYRNWAEGGVGLSLTGNVMVDREHLERPGNVAIVSRNVHPGFADWASAGKSHGGQIWMQIGHAGRQTPKYVNAKPKGPSVSKLALAGQFGEAQAYDCIEIEQLISRFADAAWVAKKSGFTGVQVHAAHGFLISQFLSPLLNQRKDQWGGSLVNRARLLISIIESIREAVGPSFPVSVKLNSEDFQQGGFSLEECLTVVKWLGECDIDLLEVTGGSYEKPQMIGYERINGDKEINGNPGTSQRTLRREAYFLNYAKKIRTVAKMPIMVTGGFRSRAVMSKAIMDNELDLIGLARPLIIAPDLPLKMLTKGVELAPSMEDILSDKPRLLGPRSSISLVRLVNIQGQQGWFYHQLRRMGKGQEPDLSMGIVKGLLSYLVQERKAAYVLKRPL